MEQSQSILVHIVHIRSLVSQEESHCFNISVEGSTEQGIPADVTLAVDVNPRVGQEQGDSSSIVMRSCPVQSSQPHPVPHVHIQVGLLHQDLHDGVVLLPHRPHQGRNAKDRLTAVDILPSCKCCPHFVKFSVLAKLPQHNDDLKLDFHKKSKD